MFLSLLWPALFFTALLSAGMVAFTLITRLERTVAVRASPPRLRRRSLLLTAFGLALTALPFDLPAAHRLWLPPAAALLIALAWLDGRHRWLPDRLTQPLLWGGMLCNLDARWATLSDAVIGAAAGYGGCGCSTRFIDKCGGVTASARVISNCWRRWAPGSVGRCCRCWSVWRPCSG